MKEARHDLGVAGVIKAEALGVPGQRTFRIVVEAERGSAQVWLEKEQLSALGLAIRQFMDEAGQGPAGGTPPVGATAAQPSFDFKVASLGLAYDEGRHLFAVLAYDADDVEAEQATLAVWVSRRSAERLAEEALEVVAAGRPVCALCKQSMDPDGHVCVRTNGHKHTVDEL